MRRLFLAMIVVVITAAILAAPAQAEPMVNGIEVKAPDRLTVGDRFHVVITLEGLNGTKVGLAPGALPGEFAVVSTPKTSSKSTGNGRSQITLDLEVAAFFPGDAVIPPLVLDYEEPDGSRGQVVTPFAPLSVTSVLPADANAIQARDLKPQLEIGKASNLGIFLAALVLVVIALAVVSALIIRSIRAKPLPVAMEVDTSELGPEDRARAILEAAGVRFAADRDFVTYYGTIAVTIRNYLTERYGFHAFALTTVELRNEMNRRGIDRWQARLVDGLLTQCDSAVYARYTPAIERSEHDLTAAYEIVEMSRPRPEPVEEPAAAEEEVGVR